MARFLGRATGRTTTTYVDTTVNTACSELCTYTNTCIGCACSQLCTYVNTACSNLCTYVNTACSNLCSYVNTCKVACNGSGAGLSNVVNSITAGSNISVNQSTGGVTICSTGGDPKVLYKCSNWGGSATIPSGDRGVYRMYTFKGAVGCFNYFCSQASLHFAGCGGCVANKNEWCCTLCSCGFIDNLRNGGFGCYTCAGNIPWVLGCSSSATQFSACTPLGWTFEGMIVASDACNGANRGFRYCFVRNGVGGGYNRFCGGIRNAGVAISCCGGFPACLIGLCFTTPSASGGFCSGSITIMGHGKIG